MADNFVIIPLGKSPCTVIVKMGKRRIACDCPHLQDSGGQGEYTVYCGRLNRRMTATGKGFRTYIRLRRKLSELCPCKRNAENVIS